MDELDAEGSAVPSSLEDPLLSAPPPLGENPHRAPSLRWNFSWTLFGNVGYVASQWGVIVALARFGDPHTVGQFALGLALAAPVIFFFNLGLRGIQATDAALEFKLSEYCGLRVLTTALAAFTIGVVVLVAGFEPSTTAAILAVTLAKCVESVEDILYGAMQRREEMKGIALSLLLRGGLGLTTAAVAARLTSSAAWSALALALSWALVLLVHDIPKTRRLSSAAEDAAAEEHVGLRPTWTRHRQMRLVRMSLPLGVAATLISLNPNVPRYFVEAQLGTRALGIYSALGYATVGATIIVTALGQSIAPRLGFYVARGDIAAFKTLIERVVYFSILLGALGVGLAAVFGQYVLELLYGPEYSRHHGVLTLFMLVTALSYVTGFLGYALTAARALRSQPPVIACAIVASAASSAILIPELGLPGAVLGYGAALLVQMAGFSVVLSATLRGLMIRPTK